MGRNGTSDQVTVNIGPNFSGSISVVSDFADKEIDKATINLPPGWRAKLLLFQPVGNENPVYQQLSYIVFDDQDLPRGTMQINSNGVHGVPCFARGTLIRTPDGDVPIEALAPGDLVLTRDHGAQALRWIGSVRLDAENLAAAPKLRPIRIGAGALGQDLPATDLVGSPQHRVLIRSQIAQRCLAPMRFWSPPGSFWRSPASTWPKT